MALSLDLTYDVIGKLNRALTSQDICDSLTGFTGQYGLTSMITASLPAPHEHKARAQKRHLLVSAFPPGWMDHYLSQDYAHIDPIVRRCKHNLLPFLWSDSAPFTREDQRGVVSRMFGEACEFNLKAGYVVPMITLDGAIIALSLGGEAADMAPTAQGMISMISAFAIGRAIGLRDQERRRKRSKLTAREVECLKWAAEGKTEWEIGEILSISENTADKHLVNARRKLGAANRAQAVANAIRWGLIA